MVEEVKKILGELEHIECNKYGDKFIEAALSIQQIEDTAQQICQLKDTECQERIEKLLDHIEAEYIDMKASDIRQEWQALKKQEGVK